MHKRFCQMVTVFNYVTVESYTQRDRISPVFKLTSLKVYILNWSNTSNVRLLTSYEQIDTRNTPPTHVYGLS